MTCPFCGQWNPDDKQRCCFCENLLQGGEDATISGRPAYERKLDVKLVSALPDKYAALPTRPRQSFHLNLKLTPNQALIAGVGLVIVLLVALFSC